ncbi:MAG: HIT family protein [Alphaproteobacteria bacterium]|nr:HIT family protein [Alphaproteobacteria bacterium]
MTECIFCKIIEKRPDPTLTIFENEHVIGQISLQQKPGNHGHVLVIPKQHVQNIYELPDELNAPLMSALRLLSRVVKKAFAAEGIHIRQNNEPAAGQDVFHLHFHVIPRYQEDEFDTQAYERLPLERRQELAKTLVDALQLKS